MAVINYEEFGKRFVADVITADRVETTLSKIVSGEFETEVKMAVGLVRANGSGTVNRIEVDQVSTEHVRYRATLSIDLSLVVRVSGVPYRYEGKGRVALDLYPELHDDLSIFVHVNDVQFEDVTLTLRPTGRVAAILDQLGGIEDQVRREIVRFVNRRKDEPEALKERRLDLRATIEEEWARRQGGP